MLRTTRTGTVSKGLGGPPLFEEGEDVPGDDQARTACMVAAVLSRLSETVGTNVIGMPRGTPKATGFVVAWTWDRGELVDRMDSRGGWGERGIEDRLSDGSLLSLD